LEHSDARHLFSDNKVSWEVWKMLFDAGLVANIWEEKEYRIDIPSETSYQFGRIIVGLGAAALLKLDIKQSVPLPEGPKIFVANHPTTADPGPLTLLSKEPMSIMIAETLYKVPVLGKYLRNSGHITVIPGQGKQVLTQSMQVLKSGKNIGIFLEGSLSPLNGGFMRPRTGTARLALMSGAPVIPVGIYLDKSHVRLLHTKVEGKIETSRWCLNGPYAMTVGKPIYLSGDVGNRSLVRSISDRIMHRVVTLAKESESRVKDYERQHQPDSWLPRMWSHCFPD
jgi:1-acyl-sn-glycerol-3-phosphate acyltransferase